MLWPRMADSFIPRIALKGLFISDLHVPHSTPNYSVQETNTEPFTHTHTQRERERESEQVNGRPHVLSGEQNEALGYPHTHIHSPIQPPHQKIPTSLHEPLSTLSPFPSTDLPARKRSPSHSHSRNRTPSKHNLIPSLISGRPIVKINAPRAERRTRKSRIWLSTSCST
jgi:hypothetical protein